MFFDRTNISTRVYSLLCLFKWPLAIAILGVIIMDVVMLGVIMLGVIMLCVIMLCVIMLDVVMLSQNLTHKHWTEGKINVCVKHSSLLHQKTCQKKFYRISSG